MGGNDRPLWRDEAELDRLRELKRKAEDELPYNTKEARKRAKASAMGEAIQAASRQRASRSKDTLLHTKVPRGLGTDSSTESSDDDDDDDEIEEAEEPVRPMFSSLDCRVTAAPVMKTPPPVDAKRTSDARKLARKERKLAKKQAKKDAGTEKKEGLKKSGAGTRRRRHSRKPKRAAKKSQE